MDSRPVGHPQRNRMLLLFTIYRPPTAHTFSFCVTVSRRKDWMYLIPAFLLRRLRGLIMRNIWRLHVGVCSLPPSLLNLLISSYFLTFFSRGLVKAAGASSFRKAENATTHNPSKIERVSSDSSSISSQEKKKGIFRSRK